MNGLSENTGNAIIFFAERLHLIFSIGALHREAFTYYLRKFAISAGNKN